jgi:hypothetical protein
VLNTDLPAASVVRANHLFEVSNDQAQALVSNLWRCWLRHVQVMAGLLAAEQLVNITRPLPLNTDLPDHPECLSYWRQSCTLR